MLIFNILSLVYTYADYKIYSMYDIATDSTLVFVDIHEAFGLNLKITAINSEKKMTQKFENGNIESYITNKYPHLLNHPDLMYLNKQYRYGFFTSINSYMFYNDRVKIHIHLLEHEFIIVLPLNKNTDLKLMKKFSIYYRNYFKFLLYRFNNNSRKIKQISEECGKLKNRININEHNEMESFFQCINENIIHWKKLFDKFKNGKVEEIFDEKQNYDYIDLNFNLIRTITKLTNTTYSSCAYCFKTIIDYFDDCKNKLGDDFLSYFDDLKRDSENLLKDYIQHKNHEQKIENIILSCDKNPLEEINNVEKDVSSDTKEEIKITHLVNKSATDNDKENKKNNEKSEVKDCKSCENIGNQTNNENNKKSKPNYINLFIVLGVILLGFILIAIFYMK